MTKTFKMLALGATLPFLLLADLSPEAPLGVSLVREAGAIVGVPLSPVSYAGVARRTTRRVVAVEATAATTAAATTAAASSQQAATAQQQQAVAQQQAATAQKQADTAQKQQAQAARPAGAPPIGSVVPALPAGCVSAPKDGVEYFNCSGVNYRTAFQGNNLVYVVQ